MLGNVEKQKLKYKYLSRVPQILNKKKKKEMIILHHETASRTQQTAQTDIVCDTLKSS